MRPPPVILVAVCLGSVLASAAEPANAPAPTSPGAARPPLLAHWTFDEPSGDRCADATGHGFDAAPPAGRGAGITRVAGVFSNALHFSGQHLLQISHPLDLRGVTNLTFSAWVQPAAFERYNEILRKEDGDQRVLFSFQEHGTVLSLGLNAGGYVECDAKIDPAELIDGQWHHCAATFDGTWMRVFLDGREIGATQRKGRLQAGGSAPACLGSMNGSECFQGAMDDLRLYRDALTADEIAALFRLGQPEVERLARATEQRIAAFLAPAGPFTETLAGTRQRIAQSGQRPTREDSAAVLRRIKARHKEEFDEFSRTTGIKPLDYLLASDVALNSRDAGRLMELLTEYKPLTESQWKRQSPDELKQWKEIEHIQKQFEELKAHGAAAQFSPEWIELMLSAGRRIQLRPYLQEAVAPHVPARTPETRNLSAAEARAALERDWLHQADQSPAPARIRSEIEWTRRLAKRIQASHPDRTDFAKELSELAVLERRADALTAPSRELYLQTRALKRRVLFANPVVDFQQLLFVDMPYPQGSEWQHETRHRLGYMAVPGGRLLVLDGLSPAGKLRQLLPQAPLHGSFWRPDVSWDASKVLFCFKPHNEKSFHLYEINFDGSGVRQITDGPFDDLDPIYLPDDRHIAFSTTRGHTYVRCMPPTSAFVLARSDLSGGNMYFISANNEPDYLPSVMPDGRILYTRWEYTDKPLWRAQKLWTTHPDGTQVNTLWGNQSVWPDLLKDARSIPGSRRVMFTGSAHHDWFAGSVGIVDPEAGLNFPQGLTKVTADVTWPECGNGPVDPIESPTYHRSGSYAAYYSPYPLSERDFLVSANRGGKFVLYLMDVEGNRELIYEGAHHALYAEPIRPRSRPPVIQDRVQWPVAQGAAESAEGLFYSGDINAGAPAQLRGKARFLRVLSIDHKTYTYWHQRPYISTGPVVSGVQSDGVKRILGTVPIESDGSVSFRAPAGIPLHFQLLDGDQRALQTMRSFTSLMPGEQHGCVGCHESHSAAPEYSRPSIALAKPPRTITPPPWSDTTVSYPRYVRPVLDRYCGKCHTGDGEGRKTLDLTARPGFLEFDESYWLFTGRPTWGQPYPKLKNPPPGWGIADTIMVEAFGTTDPAGYRTPEPMTALSFKSRLIELASSGKHYEVKVDAVNLLRLITWVDTMCPYRGDEEIREIPDPEFQGVDWLAVRPKIKTAPRISRPGPIQ